MAEENVYDCIVNSKRAEWKDGDGELKNAVRAGSKNYFCPIFFAPSTENKIRESQDFSKRSSDAPKYCASVVQPSAASKIQNHKFTTVVLIERALEDSGDEPMAIYCPVIDQAVS